MPALIQLHTQIIDLDDVGEIEEAEDHIILVCSEGVILKLTNEDAAIMRGWLRQQDNKYHAYLLSQGWSQEEIDNLKKVPIAHKPR